EEHGQRADRWNARQPERFGANRDTDNSFRGVRGDYDPDVSISPLREVNRDDRGRTAASGTPRVIQLQPPRHRGSDQSAVPQHTDPTPLAEHSPAGTRRGPPVAAARIPCGTPQETHGAPHTARYPGLA